MTADTASIRDAFLDIRDRLAPFGEQDYAHGDKSLFHPIFEQINRLAGLPVDEAEVDALAEDPELREAFAAVNELRSVYGPRLEAERARQVIESKDPWKTLSDFIFYPNYLELARMETKGAGLDLGARVVFLGSGPCPLSCVTMCTVYDMTCTGIERDAAVAELSREMVDRLDLGGRLKILVGDHELLPLDQDTDLTMVAAAAEPKDRIFELLAARLPRWAKVSFRTHERGLRRLICLEDLLTVPEGFREIARVRPTPPVINTCVFLERI